MADETCQYCDGLRLHFIEQLQSVIEGLKDQELGIAVIQRAGPTVAAIITELSTTVIEAEMDHIDQRDSPPETQVEEVDDDAAFFDNNQYFPHA